MSLKYAILGMLSSTPSSGYQLGRIFSEGAGAFWEASSSQIYPELRRLEEQGLISGEVSLEDRLNRRVYSLTDAGMADLRGWVEAPLDYPPRRDPERIQLFFLDWSDRQTIERHLQRHRRHYERELKMWEREQAAILALTHPRLKDRMAQRPKAEWKLIVGLKQAAIDGNIERARLEIDWADRTLAWLAGLSAEELRDARPEALRQAG